MKVLFPILVLFVTTHISAQQLTYRDSVDVTHYHIRLNLSNLNNETLYGNTTLFITPTFEILQNIKLDLWGLQVDKVVQGDKRVEFSQYNSVLSIVPNTPLTSDDTIQITVTYHGKPKKDESWGGFFITPNHAFNFGIGMATTPPNFGRVWYPCIDSFTDRATYEYSIKVKSGNAAACPGTLKSVSNNSDNTQTWHWKLHNTIPTYLSSVAVSDYHIINDSVVGLGGVIPIEIFIDKNKVEKGEKAFEHLKEFLHSFENVYGPYVWERIGYVSTPFKGGAMEHATNIAYSSRCIGQPGCENTLAHELSHHWFGNLVTCRTEKDMWLNEGWSSYSEALFIEHQYGEKAYKAYNRKRHQRVLQLAHLYDRGYRALYGIPHDYTYGATVYKKGADVAMALRSYLGDSLFFSTLKQYFVDYAFKDISTVEFRDYFSKTAKVELTDFFNFWVFNAGFPHFTIANYKVTEVGNRYTIDYKILQHLKETDNYLKSTLEVGYLDASWQINKETIHFDSKETKLIRDLNFEPLMILIDPDEKTPDATTDEYRTVKTRGNEEFAEELFEMEINGLTDSAFIRITHHWIKPLQSAAGEKEYDLADRYWQVQYLSNGELQASGNFEYNLTYALDSNLQKYQSKNLRLLYRAIATDEWQIVKAKQITEGKYSHFRVDNLRTGEYVIAGITN